MIEVRYCKGCKEEHPIDAFYIRKETGKPRAECKKCFNLKQMKRVNKNKTKYKNKGKNYYLKNKEHIKQKAAEYRNNNKEKILAYQRRNVDKQKIYNKENREKILTRQVKYNKNKRKNDPIFKLRDYISTRIRNAINKKDNSCLKYLNYTPQQLKEHLESLFEPWMNWNNHGQYLIKDWKDDDQSTWKWQIDHIIPCSILPFTSMEDENFKRCWALSNLRPLSAKQNLLDGVNKVRHKIKDNNVI